MRGFNPIAELEKRKNEILLELECAKNKILESFSGVDKETLTTFRKVASSLDISETEKRSFENQKKIEEIKETELQKEEMISKEFERIQALIEETVSKSKEDIENHFAEELENAKINLQTIINDEMESAKMQIQNLQSEMGSSIEDIRADLDSGDYLQKSVHIGSLNYGLQWHYSGKLCIAPASENQIDQRVNAYLAITPKTLKYAVDSVLKEHGLI